MQNNQASKTVAKGAHHAETCSDCDKASTDVVLASKAA
jgi:hypothetical protein